jgi:hypothetical protein
MDDLAKQMASDLCRTGLLGMPVYIDDQLGVERRRVQTCFPRSKKKRIRNKFAKQSRNFRTLVIITPVSYQVGNAFFMNSLAYERIKKGISKQ